MKNEKCIKHFILFFSRESEEQEEDEEDATKNSLLHIS